jgi:hypothetical protein
MADKQPVFSDTIILDDPVVRGDQIIDKVQVRKPQAGELRGLKMGPLIAGDVDSYLTLLPRITVPNLLTHELEGLDPSNQSDLINEAMYFLLPRSMKAQLQT